MIYCSVSNIRVERFAGCYASISSVQSCHVFIVLGQSLRPLLKIISAYECEVFFQQAPCMCVYFCELGGTKKTE